MHTKKIIIIKKKNHKSAQGRHSAWKLKSQHLKSGKVIRNPAQGPVHEVAVNFNQCVTPFAEVDEQTHLLQAMGNISLPAACLISAARLIIENFSRTS